VQKVTSTEKFQKSAFAGYSIQDQDQYCLYMPDGNTPLHVCGDTRLKGNAFLPTIGLKKGFIAGVGYSGDKLIEGATYRSGRTMPELFVSLADTIQDFLQQFTTVDQSQLVDYAELNNYHSFNTETYVYFDAGPIIISDLSCRGNYLIISENSISIMGNAHLEDIIVYAPYIEIQSGFTGSLQGFATDSVFIGSQSHLTYPSAMSLITNNSGSSQNNFLISESSRIDGLVYVKSNQPDKDHTFLSIGNNAVINGQVFCDGLMEMQGTLFGNLVCRKFILFTPSSVYENYLLNVNINSNDLDDDFAFLIPDFRNRSYGKVLKWIE